MFIRFLTFVSIVLIASGLGLIGGRILNLKNSLLSPVVVEIKTGEKPLDRYSIENLRKANIPPVPFVIGSKLSDSARYSSHLFYLGNRDSSVSGLMNIPKLGKPLGTVILLRGFVPREIFESGMGTKRIGEYLAGMGILTLAPDFLGYGQSAMPSVLPLEERFQTYTTVLQLLNSMPGVTTELKTINPGMDTSKILENPGIFGHSNGGHIALAVLEITGRPYPTVLWAPVSKPFPYSILAYTDEFEDKGRALRKLIADFEKDYDITLYSIDGYFDLIQAPVAIHQGEKDEEVPYWWSEELAGILREKGKTVTYAAYPREDHNFNTGGSWETMAARTADFYFKNFAQTP